MKYDLHMHTCYSRCSNLRPDLLLKIAKKKGLDGVAITDHMEMKGALEVKKLNKDKDFEVIIGEEVSTDCGDVLVYHANEKITKIDFFEVLDEVRKQGALISIAHPFRTTLINNHKFRLPLSDVKEKVDAIECFNARTLPGDNKKAIEQADKLKIAATAGSDTHFFFEVGTGYTMFDGDLRTALRKKNTKVEGTIKYGAFGGVLSYLRKRML